ncbi:hypothetical protein JTB14_018809 [Gonioctena quinquepunctata]|nr:hypothetical protein JTB14_018809 [Gonioctena quinquepunctata]
MGVAEFLFRKYGSRRLLDVISSLGYCSSYQEAVRFETSSVMQPLLALWGQTLSQLVYHNADFNVRTIDGHNTFNSMGCILCVTPRTAVVPGQNIPRLKNLPTAGTVGRSGNVELWLQKNWIVLHKVV